MAAAAMTAAHAPAVALALHRGLQLEAGSQPAGDFLQHQRQEAGGTLQVWLVHNSSGRCSPSRSHNRSPIRGAPHQAVLAAGVEGVHVALLLHKFTQLRHPRLHIIAPPGLPGEALGLQAPPHPGPPVEGMPPVQLAGPPAFPGV